MSTFYKKSLEERKLEVCNILTKYPDRVPLHVDKAKNSNLPDLDKKKFLVPIDFTVGQLLFLIRKKITLNESDGLYIFFNNNIANGTNTIGEVYKKYKNKDDNMLYVIYAAESAFGYK